MKHFKLIAIVAIVMTIMSCQTGNVIKFQSVGKVDLDTLNRDIRELIYELYSSNAVDEYAQELYLKVAEEYEAEVDKANAQSAAWNSMFGDLIPSGHTDYDYDSIVESINSSIEVAWSNIKYIMENNISSEDFPFGDVDDMYAPEMIQYWYEIISPLFSTYDFTNLTVVSDIETQTVLTASDLNTGLSYQVILTPILGNDEEYNIYVESI